MPNLAPGPPGLAFPTRLWNCLWDSLVTALPPHTWEEKQGDPEPQSRGQRAINTRLGCHKSHSFTLQGRSRHCRAKLQFVTLGIYCYLLKKIRYFKLSRNRTLIYLCQVLHFILKPRVLSFLFWVFEEVSEPSPWKNVHTHYIIPPTNTHTLTYTLHRLTHTRHT